MSDDVIQIEIDGKEHQAKRGQMIIEATDAAKSYVPRFCYHTKLSVAANCRMCLVEVKKAPKPLPACATPVAEGMKIFTRSPYAIAAQKATMEFLLINHPLDCPICDQGGECELQDIAMGYGRGVSRYNDNKRVVKDKDIGPLVSTDMTRCIHCTRCVRFGEEVTGVQDLGTVMRGENMRIDTYVEKSIDHELSANIIDLCPVGALNNKPYRYSARSWEMVQHETIAAHDCVGSNLYAHVLRGKIKRIVPRENESINETWLSDRDRFSYEGVYSENRLTTPMRKKADQWETISWEEALLEVVEKIKLAEPAATAFLASPSSTIEECYLLSKLAEERGINSLDHRLRVKDFTDQANDPNEPLLGIEIAAIEQCDQIILIGSDIRREAPILGHRIRKAALSGANISIIDENIHQYYFDLQTYLSDGLIKNLAAISMALGGQLPASLNSLASKIKLTDEHQKIAVTLKKGDKKHLILGHAAINHPYASIIRLLTSEIANLSNASYGYVTQGANTAGANLMGIHPTRDLAGKPRAEIGRNTQEIVSTENDLLVLLNAEPVRDIPALDAASNKSKFVIALTTHATENHKEVADLLLPIGSFAETSGTYINCEGRWQSFSGVSNPVGESRPAWKVLRAIGSLLEFKAFEYDSSESILEEVTAKLQNITSTNGVAKYSIQMELGKQDVLGEQSTKATPMYETDMVLRHATSLQLTPEAARSSLK